MDLKVILLILIIKSTKARIYSIVKGDYDMDEDLEVKEMNTSNYQTMFPGYENHIYKTAFTGELKAPDKMPTPPCHS